MTSAELDLERPVPFRLTPKAAMTAAGDVACPSAASFAVTLTDVLDLGLPEPNYITVCPWVTSIRAIGMQFTRTADPLGSLRAWAAHFGVAVGMLDPGHGIARVCFSYDGVGFECYADLTPDEP